MKKFLRKQIAKGLDKTTWLVVMHLLIGAGYVEVARHFSKLSTKHDYKSSKLIEELSINGECKNFRCAFLGCTEKQVEKCFAEVCTNDAGEITNSPAGLIRHCQEDNEEIGFHYSDDGCFRGINGSMFAKHILRNYKIASREGTKFYLYHSNRWNEISRNRLRKTLRNFFNKFEPDKWSSRVEKIYFDNLELECQFIDDLQPATNYINLTNGLLNIETFKLEKHDEKIFSTVQLPISYDHQAKCPEFLNFLNDIFLGDNELVALMQEIMGYCLSCETKAQKMFIFLGDGSNGKGVLCDVFYELAGGVNHVSSRSLKKLESQFGPVQIVNKTLNISAENELKESLDTEIVKAITSGSPITVEEKHEPAYTYRPFVKLVFCMNSLPYTLDKTYAFERRLIIVPFDKKFVDKPVSNHLLASQGKNDPNILEKMLPELQGIFTFAIEGYKRLKSNDFNFSDSKKVTSLLDEYRLDINPYLDFVRRCLEPVPATDNTRILNHDMWNAFREWSYQNGHTQMSTVNIRKFSKQLRSTLTSENIPYEYKGSDGKYYFHHLKFTPDASKLIKSSARRKSL